MTAERKFKKRVRERMKVTGEKYTTARRRLREQDDEAFERSLDREREEDTREAR